ncbi:MAG: carbon storage regulator CsrA [Fidelibacterota bacterium]|nr:MAG: carbon storage regulator CsrA [Candidatus Neomarinimicrobiota bacterium]
MLVLTRKSGQSIRVGEGILLKVLECKGSYVKIGITAPPQLPVHREEVYLRIREENLAAVKGRENVRILLESAPEGLRRTGLASGEVRPSKRKSGSKPS